MRRDIIDPSAVSSVESGTQPVRAPEELVRLAHGYWLDSLNKNGNQPSRNHQDAGWQLIRAMVDQLYGVRTGRFAYAVPCGGGKTQAVIALLLAMRSLKLTGCKTVMVVAQEVRALFSIKRQLLSAGMPEQSVGIVHSKASGEYASTGEDKRSIMLVTHARVQQDGSLPTCCVNRHGQIHDLVIWDEALITTEAICLKLDSTLTALGHFAKTCFHVGSVYERLQGALARERADQDKGKPARELPPLITEGEAASIDCELKGFGHLDDTGLSLRSCAILAIRLLQNPFALIDPRSGDSECLMRYVIKVPDELYNIVILDASHNIDALRQADKTIRSGTTEAMIKFKDFSTVTVIHYPLASGRSAMKADGRAFIEAARLSNGISADEGVLFVTFKDWHEGRLIKELRSEGISLSRHLPCGRPSRSVITWGRHTSDNSFTHCKHVILVGLHRLPLVATASQLAAQSRDLTHRRDKAGLLSIEATVIAGHVMQAMSRGRMRLTDAEGKAHPMVVHIIAKDDLRPLLAQAMNGLRWETRDVKPPTRTKQAVRDISDLLVSYDKDRISKKELFDRLQLGLEKDAKASALKDALVVANLKLRAVNTRWYCPPSSRSLLRVRQVRDL